MHFKEHPKAEIVIKALLLTGVIFVSYFVGIAINGVLNLSNNLISGIWCAVSAIVVFDDLPENARKLMKDRLLGTFVGALFTTLFLSWSNDALLSIAVSIFLVGLLIIFFKWEGALKVGCITVLIIGLTSQHQGFKVIWQSGLMRFLECVAGGLISLFATLLIHKVKSFIDKAGNGD